MRYIKKIQQKISFLLELKTYFLLNFFLVAKTSLHKHVT